MIGSLLLAMLITAYPASAPAGAELLLKSRTSWNGGSFAYPKGDAEITAWRVTLDQGERTPVHCHPVPTMGYILSGVLEVATPSGDRVTLGAGSAMVEVMAARHSGRAVEGPVEILVFYAGAAGLPNTIPSDGDDCGMPGDEAAPDASGTVPE